jgi:hypothetical protein
MLPQLVTAAPHLFRLHSRSIKNAAPTGYRCSRFISTSLPFYEECRPSWLPLLHIYFDFTPVLSRMLSQLVTAAPHLFRLHSISILSPIHNCVCIYRAYSYFLLSLFFLHPDIPFCVNIPEPLVPNVAFPKMDSFHISVRGSNFLVCDIWDKFYVHCSS